MQIGQHVLLTDDNWTKPNPRRGNVRPVKGVVYTIRDIFTDPHGCKALRLAEIVNPVMHWKVDGRPVGPLELGFVARRFRPLSRLTVEDFVSTTAPVEEFA